MADFLERLVARSRVPTPAPSRTGRPSFAIEDDVVRTPRSPDPGIAPPPAATVAPAAPAPPVGTVPAPPPGAGPEPAAPEPTVARVEVPASPGDREDVPREVSPDVQGSPEQVTEKLVIATPAPVEAPPVEGAPSDGTDASTGRRPHPEAEGLIDVRTLEPQDRRREEREEPLLEARTHVRTEVVTEVRPAPVAVTARPERPLSAAHPLVPAPLPAAPSSEPAPPDVHIHIGQLDVRGAERPEPAVPDTQAPPGPTGPTSPVLSLGDYLRGRAEAGP